MRPGRCFVRQIYELTKIGSRRPNQQVRLNRGIRGDVEWWHLFMSTWNGVSLFWKNRKDSPDVTVWSDAAKTWGYGALTKGAWFQHPWPEDLPQKSIAYLELVPIVMSAFIWGRKWKGKIVMFMCDNEAVVSIVNKLYSKDEDISQLMRCLVFVAARFNFWFVSTHIAGHNNTGADLLSRNKFPIFLAQRDAPNSGDSYIANNQIGSHQVGWISSGVLHSRFS